jgi:endonuclease-8
MRVARPPRVTGFAGFSARDCAYEPGQCPNYPFSSTEHGRKGHLVPGIVVHAGVMPEGDVVWRTARSLDDALTGRVLSRSDFRVPRYATTDLTGRTVTETVSRGKHLLTRVEGDVTVHTHLKMEGNWRVSPAAGYALRDHRIRLILANEEWEAVGYLLGTVEVIRTSREEQAVGHLGPDLLGPAFDVDEAVRRLSSDPGRTIGEALLDQRTVAGIGTIYRAETLFLRGVNPWRQVSDVSDLPALVETARRLLDANKARPATVTTGLSARGADMWVYGRAGRPCRRCGSLIRKANLGPAIEERIAVWCPRCQPL